MLERSRGQVTGGVSATERLWVHLKDDGMPSSGLGLGVMGSGLCFEKVSAYWVGDGLEEDPRINGDIDLRSASERL